MAVSHLRSFLERHRRVALDTSIFIYQIEANPRYVALTEAIFDWLEQPRVGAVTSTITMTELLVLPYKKEADDQAAACFALLAAYPNLQWVAPDLEIADLAARMRASYRLRTPDALQAATAAHSGVTGFITNDEAFARVPAFQTLLLDRLL